MADSVIGALRVLLGVDTAAFSEGLTKAEKSLANFSKQFGTIAAGAAAAVVAAGAALSIGIEKSLEQADKLGKMAQKFGVPVEELSKLKFAAELSDVSLEALGKGLGKLSKALTEAAAKPTSEAANAFRALDISVRNADGSVKSSEQGLLDVAERFAELKDGAGKTAVSMALFGKAGADLIPLLNQGKTGIQALKDEAEKLGLVITATTAKSAEEFNDNLKRLNTTWSAVMTQLAAGAAGPLAEVSASLVELQRSSEATVTAGNVLGQLFQSLVEGFVIAAAHIRGIATDIYNLWNLLKALPGTANEIAAAWKQLTDGFASSVQEIKNIQGAFAFSLGNLPALINQIAAAYSNAGKPQRDFNYAVMGGKSAIDSYIESVKKSIASQQAEAQTIGLGVGAKEKLKTVLEGIQIAQNNNIPVTEALRAKLQALGDQAATSAQQLAAGQIIQDAIPEWEKLEIKITSILELMGKVPDKAEQLKGALVKTQLELQNLILTATATALGQFGQLFTQFGAHNKKLFEVGKAFATAEAIVNTYKAANMALAAPPGPPFSYVYVAAAIAAGIANVLKIQQTKFQGAALGGSFRVPGGTSGFDSKLVPMMLSPGERVDVTPASRAGEGSRELVISGIKPKDFYTGENMRELVLSLDKWMKDGGTGIRLATT